MHKSFLFQGMGGGVDKALAQDGECMELVNLRLTDGSLRPVLQTVEYDTLDTLYSKIYWHEKAECYLCVTDDSTSTIQFYDSGWCRLEDSSGKVLKFSSLRGVRHVEFVGNIVCCMTSDNIQFLMSEGGTYKWLGERPVPPFLSIGLLSAVEKLLTETEFRHDTVVGEETAVWRLNEKGYIDECVFNLESKGYFIDRALFKFALRLYDGSYIYCSQPYYVCDDNVKDEVGRDGRNMLTEPVDDTEVSSKYTVKVKGFKPQLRFSGLKMSDWKGIVMGIDVFTTGSLKGKKVAAFKGSFHNASTRQYSSIEYEKYVDKDVNEIWNDVNDASLYYKYAEYDISGNCISVLDDVSMTNLLLQQGLAASEVSHDLSSKVAGCSYMLNGRLHVANLREYFFKGYDAYSLVPVGGQKKVIEGLIVEVKIKTDDGVSRVVKDYGQIELGYKDGCFEIQPLLTYPDSRAYEMNIFAILDTEKFKKRFPLAPHKYLNVAQFLNKWYLNYAISVEAVFESGAKAAYISDEDVLAIFSEKIGVHKVIYSEDEGCWLYNGAAFPPAGYEELRVFAVRRDQVHGDMLKFTIVYGESEESFKDIRNIAVDSTWQLVSGQNPYYEDKPYEDKRNVMKVSMPENPFVLPAKSTFAPSVGSIVAICSNTVELSQGKFGEHPLFVFCNDGIWAMATDPSGTVAYSASYPIAKEICRNASSVCNVNGGIVFVSDRGVMLLSGCTVRDVSEQLLPDSENNAIMNGSSLVKEILSKVGLEGVVDSMRFLDFVKGGCTAYMSETNEVIFGNNKARYCYVLSLDNGVWRKINVKVLGFVRDPVSLNMFRHEGYETIIGDFGVGLSGDNKIALVTRPMQWGTALSKRIVRLVLHAYVALKKSGNSPSFGCYLLCSNDGANFKLLSGVERDCEAQDLSLPDFLPSSYRYFVIAVVGDVGADTTITGVELEFALAWNNRLGI